MNPGLISHLIELRRRIIFTALGFGLCFIGLFPWCNQLYQLLATPLLAKLGTNVHLIATEVTAPFFVPVKLAALVAFTISLPHTIYQLWQFVAPGLYRQERKLISSIIISSLALFTLGIAFCYYLVLPTVFHFIANFKSPLIDLFTDIDKYLSFIINLFMVFGLAFETPIIIFLLIYFNILPFASATKHRRLMLVISFIIAAILTPPDVVSQTMLALPLYALYELGILSARIILKPID
jgi:sec-independent protein translocase protein TatC